jgi:RsiW-degrading membrane proteinase PrsW (M82 family)
MDLSTAMRAPIGLLPVLAFLAALVYMDSYKLVRFRYVLIAIGIGALAAGGSYVANMAVLGVFDIPFQVFYRYVSPVIEEVLKAGVLIWLIRTNRLGLLVDAAIIGFAIGTGFAVTENLYYLFTRGDGNTALWIVRGFGTAWMHGGATAIFALISLAVVETRNSVAPAVFLPGLLGAIALHSVFNHFIVWPVYSTLGMLVILPVLLYHVFRNSEETLRHWLGADFDSDAELLEMISSPGFRDSQVGQYLQSLNAHFQGEVMADLLCYLRLHVELGLRAKGILMMRENGFDVTVGEETLSKFEELKYLDQSIGRTGRRALQPILQMSHKDLWQFYVLEK